jgi:hypothetical protein
MAELLVFTLLAAIAGVYAILPDHRRLRIRYTLTSFWPRAVLATSFVTIITTYVAGLYLQPPASGPLERVATPFGILVIDAPIVEITQLVAALAVVAIFARVFIPDSVPIRDEDALLNLLRTLYNREEYATLIDVISENYSPLIDPPSEPTPPQPQTYMQALEQMHESLEEENAPERSAANTDEIPSSTISTVGEEDTKDWISELLNSSRERVENVRYRLAMWRFRRAERADAAAYTETLLTDPEFGAHHPLLAPELGLRIISDDSLKSFPRRKFAHMYLRTLFNAENSLLYREVRQDRALEDTRLFQTLFANCELAKTLDVYKPIGDCTRDLLRHQGSKDHDHYNERNLKTTEHSDDHLRSDPIFVAIKFFDILVREAFYQRMTWHMWLYYYETFAEEICRNYELVTEDGFTTDWANDYSRLLNEIVTNMTRWLQIIERMERDSEFDIRSPENPTDSENAVSDSESLSYEEFIRLDRIDTDRGANIPKATVICLVSCHKEILTTNSIPSRFKSSITHTLLDCCHDLYQHEKGSLPRKYGELMIHCIEEEMNSRREGEAYRHAFDEAYRNKKSTGVRHELIMKTTKDIDFVGKIDGAIENI